MCNRPKRLNKVSEASKMGDSQEENREIAEKNSKLETISSDIENKPENESVTKIFSDEKLEKVHECVESKESVELTTEAQTYYGKGKNEGKLKAEKDTKDNGPEEPLKEETKLEENKAETNKTKISPEKQCISNSVLSCTGETKEKIIRNQSDIFSLKEVPTTLQTSIFSVNGCPSRKLFRKQEPPGHLFQRNDDPPADKVASPRGLRITKENYNDEKRPSSSYRNPLTGSGLSSNDEYKSKGIKRRDGNPLLGLGYDSEVPTSASQHRIPPGGYSHKLW